MIRLLYRTYEYIFVRVFWRWCKLWTLLHFYVNNVKHSKFSVMGIPLIDIHPKGKCTFGPILSMVSKDKYATLGKNNRCKILVSSGAVLTVGSKVGMSNTTIVATTSVTIGNNVLMGGGVMIVDSDFHSLNPIYWHTPSDVNEMARVPVVIKDNVFIGMNSIILKGVTIGSNVVIAAGSVVSKDIPDNQIWGGNPARYIKNKAQY